MVMTTIDYIVTIIVIGVVCAIFYKALKEPIDTVGRLIKKAFGGARDKLAESGGEGQTIIRYG